MHIIGFVGVDFRHAVIDIVQRGIDGVCQSLTVIFAGFAYVEYAGLGIRKQALF